jgi:Na+/glutamate symporter
MRISPYGLMVLVILAIGTPTLVFAQTESETNEGANDVREKQSSTPTESEHEGSTSSVNSSLILFVTVIAIASVVGYSIWKVYKTKRRAAPKKLV